jgi:NADH-quinone oxidoreductase subunit L
MEALSPIGVVALLAPLLPILAFLFVGIGLLLSRPSTEVIVARAVSLAFTGSVLATLTLAGYFIVHDDRPILLELGRWFHSSESGFEASLLIDRLSVPMMVLVAVICGVISRFSATYLVREPGQPRFYVLLSLFATGMFLLVMAGSLDLLIAGWELVGISSMLLIGFFHERTFPVRNALRTFIVYRVCDIGLLVGTVLFHHYARSASFVPLFGLDRWPSGDPTSAREGANLAALCLFFAACGKSALFPVGSWLPRAMEGPTPSSAIFYGALSVHAGAYLMLRVTPLLDHAPLARAIIVGIGLLTAVHGTLVARVQTDAKSQLAYATSTQVGVIFVEIGLGLPWLALLHLLGHASLRTLQMLRAPNAIADMMLRRAAIAAEPDTVPTQRAAPSAFRRFLYHLALSRFHLDPFWERFVAHPAMQLAHAAERGERALLCLLARGVAPEINSTGRLADKRRTP